MIAAPPPDGEINQTPVDGRNTAASVLPSPSKSAGMGMSPLVPNGKAKNELSSLRRMNHCPVDGRKKAISVLPSPVKSPGVGISLDVPKAPAITWPVELFEYHHSPV